MFVLCTKLCPMAFEHFEHAGHIACRTRLRKREVQSCVNKVHFHCHGDMTEPATAGAAVKRQKHTQVRVQLYGYWVTIGTCTRSYFLFCHDVNESNLQDLHETLAQTWSVHSFCMKRTSH
eukprot:scpid108020/ scgid6706/ 